MQQLSVGASVQLRQFQRASVTICHTHSTEDQPWPALTQLSGSVTKESLWHSLVISHARQLFFCLGTSYFRPNDLPDCIHSVQDQLRFNPEPPCRCTSPHRVRSLSWRAGGAGTVTELSQLSCLYLLWFGFLCWLSRSNCGPFLTPALLSLWLSTAQSWYSSSSVLMKSRSSSLIMYVAFFSSLLFFLIEWKNSLLQHKCAKLQCDHTSYVTILGAAMLPVFTAHWEPPLPKSTGVYLHQNVPILGPTRLRSTVVRGLRGGEDSFPSNFGCEAQTTLLLLGSPI